MKDEHIRYGEARMLPTKNVRPFVNRIYEDIITLIKKYCDEECTIQDLLDDLGYDEQCTLQDLLDDLNEKNTLEV